MRSLLALLQSKSDIVEADLDRFYRRDIRDLWRSDDRGPLLTWRQLWVRVRYLPRESALAIDDNGGIMPWSMTEHLLADHWLLSARTNSKKGKAPKDHPAREQQRKKQTAARAVKKRGAFERAKARNAERLRLAKE